MTEAAADRLAVIETCTRMAWHADAREISEPLEALAAGTGCAPERLERWLDGLVQAKRQRALEEPELFATYVELAAQAREVVRAHVETLVDQVARIVADGVAQEELAADDPRAAARAAFDATSRFHNPAHAAEWSDPKLDAAYAEVRRLVLRGLAASGPTPEAKRSPSRA